MSPTELKLIEKIVRAKVQLEGAHTGHKSMCPADDDTGYGACTCGASAQNSKVQAALRELDLGK